MSRAEDSRSPSPSSALVLLPHQTGTSTIPTVISAWRPILSVSNQVVLYNPTSHALTVRTHPGHTSSLCPYCHRPMDDLAGSPTYGTPRHTRAPNYFQLLEVANETNSIPGTPNGSSGNRRSWLQDGDLGDGDSSRPLDEASPNVFASGVMAEGYFEAFFKEERRLGMGANGSVYLCQHMLDGNPLGHFAVKKIAVGQSHSYLLQILREVRLLESLRHPNIVTYHHAWLESCQFSAFGPRVPTLFVLMQWAEGGSMDDFISSRLGRPHTSPRHAHGSPSSPSSAPSSPASSNVDPLDDHRSRSARIRAFRAAQHKPPEEREKERELRKRMGCKTAVHLLSADETKSLFQDVVGGLAFLHDRSILHLDLKPGNVLLTWDEGSLIPRAMLSDFGTSQDMLQDRHRSGNTGTLEYTAPESLPSPDTGILRQVDSKADMWSLGMILHMLLFFRLPYRYSSDGDGESRSHDAGDMDRLEKEVLAYPGFKTTAGMRTTFESRGLPSAYLLLLESLLNRISKMRPSSERVLKGIRDGNLEPLTRTRTSRSPGEGTLIPRLNLPLPPRNMNDDQQSDSEGSETTPTIEEPSPDHYDLPQSDPQAPTSNYDHSRNGTSGEKIPVVPLSLPPPESEYNIEPTLVDPDTPFRSWLRWWILLRLKAYGIRVRNQYTFALMPSHARVVPLMKSCILVAKMLSLYPICPYPSMHMNAFLFSLIISLAILDTCLDGIWISAFLGAVHAGLLKFACAEGRCCS